MVGTTGFEPATSRTPSVRATRLRHVPTGEKKPLSSVSLAFEKGQDGEQFFMQIEQEFSVRLRCRYRFHRRFHEVRNFVRGAGVTVGSRLGAAVYFRQVLARAGDRETLFVEQTLDFED